MKFPCQDLFNRKVERGFDPNKPVLPNPNAPTAPSSDLWHVNPIINGQTYEPNPDLPEWLDPRFGFEIPTHPIGCLLKRTLGPLPYGATVTIDYMLSGPVAECLRGQEGPSDPTLGLILIKRNAGWSGLPPSHEHRWYSNIFLPVTKGRHIGVVPLLISEWNGPTVNKDVPPVTEAGLRATCADPEYLGICCGDNTGRAHSWIALCGGVILTIYSLTVA